MSQSEKVKKPKSEKEKKKYENIKVIVSPKSKRNFYVICHALKIKPQDVIRDWIEGWTSLKRFKEFLKEVDKVEKRGK